MNKLHPTKMNISLHDFRRPVSFMIIIIHEIGKFPPMIFMSARVVNQFFLVEKNSPTDRFRLVIHPPPWKSEILPVHMRWSLSPIHGEIHILYIYIYIIHIHSFVCIHNRYITFLSKWEFLGRIFWVPSFELTILRCKPKGVGSIHRQEAELAVRKQLGERRGGGKLRSVYVARARRLQSFLGSWEWSWTMLKNLDLQRGAN